MPIVISTQTPSAESSSIGLSWSKIIELANKRTERRAEKTLDFDYELWDVINDFCGEADWYWRKLTAVITTVAGQAVYDLSDASNANAIGCERIIRIDSLDSPLDPVVEEDRIASVLANPGTPGTPTAFFREPGNESAIHLYPTPASDGMTLRMQFWAVVGLAPDAIPAGIPLVPPRYHNILVKGLERNCLRYALGKDGALKLQAAVAEYERLVTKAKRNRYGIVGIHRDFLSDDGDSIQST